MSNASEPAFPAHGSMGEVIAHGLSKREYFAGLAMQGMLANSMLSDRPEKIAMGAVMCADALLAALEDTK